MLDKNKKIIGIILVLILAFCLFPPIRLCADRCVRVQSGFIYNILYGKIWNSTFVNIAWDILSLQILIIVILGSIILLFKHK